MAPSGLEILDSDVLRIFADDEDKGVLRDGRRVCVCPVSLSIMVFVTL